RPDKRKPDKAPCFSFRCERDVLQGKRRHAYFSHASRRRETLRVAPSITDTDFGTRGVHTRFTSTQCDCTEVYYGVSFSDRRCSTRARSVVCIGGCRFLSAHRCKSNRVAAELLG